MCCVVLDRAHGVELTSVIGGILLQNSDDVGARATSESKHIYGKIIVAPTAVSTNQLLTWFGCNWCFAAIS
jgi:hypothetical protein